MWSQTLTTHEVPLAAAWHVRLGARAGLSRGTKPLILNHNLLIVNPVLLKAQTNSNLEIRVCAFVVVLYDEGTAWRPSQQPP